MLWGTTGTAQALAPSGAQPLAVGALRLMVGGLALLAYAWLRSRFNQSMPGTRWPLRSTLLAALCMSAYQVLFFAGVARTGVAIGTVVGIGSSPVLAGLLGWVFRGERPGWGWGFATLLALAGCGLLALAGAEIQVDPFGLLLAVGAGGAYATFALLSKDLLERKPTEQVLAVVFCLGALLLAPLLLIQPLAWLAQPRGWWVILHLGLLTTALAYTLFGRGLRMIPVASAVTVSLAEPLTAGLLGVLLLGEKLTPAAGAGIVLIFSGLLILSSQPSPAQLNPDQSLAPPPVRPFCATFRARRRGK